MIFAAPVPFEEALQSRAVQSILPTSLSSAEIEAHIFPEFTERALFSARTINAEYLQDVADVLDGMLDPTRIVRMEGEVTVGVDVATARLTLQRKLDSLGYRATPGEEGTIKDLRSDQRVDLVIDTNVRMAQGYGEWKQGQDAAVLDQWPAQELYRAMPRQKPRDWQSRWNDEGGEAFDGKMIALKNDSIWTRISRFGTPYPPFDFNSGMDVRDVDRDTAVDLGLIDRDTQIAPQDRGFNDDLQFSPEVRDRSLRQALVESDPALQFDGEGVLTLLK